MPLALGLVLACLARGLDDSYDIKLLCTNIVVRMCRRFPDRTLAHVDAITVPVEKTLNIRLKADAVKQEKDRHEDMLRTTLKLVDAFTRLIDYRGGGGGAKAAAGVQVEGVSFERFLVLMGKIEKATAFMNKLIAVREADQGSAKGADATVV